MQVAERIIAVLEEPFEMDGTALGIEASCGISMAPADGETADLLLQRADVAMYVAKGSQASVVVYSEELNVNTPARLALLGRPAQRRGPRRVRPPLPAQGGHGAPGGSQGAEALIRWQHPTLGLLPPDTFIPEAERTGLIEPMTVWVLDEALRQCRRWLDEAGPAGARRAVHRRQPVDPQPARRRPAGHGGRRPSPAGRCRPTCSTSRSPRRSS